MVVAALHVLSMATQGAMAELEAKDLGITALRIGTMTKLEWRIRAKSAHIAACHGS